MFCHTYGMSQQQVVTQLVERLPRMSTVVAANIRAEAARRGWSQTDLARALNMDRSLVSNRYRGRTEWGLDEVQRAARVFGLPFGELCAIRDSNPEPADYGTEHSDTGSVVVVDFSPTPTLPGLNI